MRAVTKVPNKNSPRVLFQDDQGGMHASRHIMATWWQVEGVEEQDDAHHASSGHDASGATAPLLDRSSTGVYSPANVASSSGIPSRMTAMSALSGDSPNGSPPPPLDSMLKGAWPASPAASPAERWTARPPEQSQQLT